MGAAGERRAAILTGSAKEKLLIRRREPIFDKWSIARSAAPGLRGVSLPSGPFPRLANPAFSGNHFLLRKGTVSVYELTCPEEIFIRSFHNYDAFCQLAFLRDG